MKQLFNKKEYVDLKGKYGANAEIKKVKLNISNRSFFEDMKKNIRNDRRGEVVFAVQRPNGKMVVIRTSFYPESVYRVPTGGINYGEDIIEALGREIKEELGLRTSIQAFLGVIEYEFIYKNEELKFYSYLFWLKEEGGNILIDALEDEVSEYREVDKEELIQTVSFLENFKTDDAWKDWCTFRSITTGCFISLLP